MTRTPIPVARLETIAAASGSSLLTMRRRIFSGQFPSADVPGLITEAATMELLIERLQILIPELMELNCGKTGPFPFHIVSERNAIAQAA